MIYKYGLIMKKIELYFTFANRLIVVTPKTITTQQQQQQQQQEQHNGRF